MDGLKFSNLGYHLSYDQSKGNNTLDYCNTAKEKLSNNWSLFFGLNVLSIE